MPVLTILVIVTCILLWILLTRFAKWIGDVVREEWDRITEDTILYSNENDEKMEDENYVNK